MELSGNKSVSFSPKSEMTQLSRSQFLSVFTDILRAMVPCALRKGLSYTTSLQHTRCLHFHQIFLLFFAPFCKLTGKCQHFLITVSKKAVFRNKICPNKDPDPGKPNQCGSGKLFLTVSQSTYKIDSAKVTILFPA